MAAPQYKGGWKPEPARNTPGVEEYIRTNRELRAARLAPHATEIDAYFARQVYNTETGLPAAS